jgi:hypothetical protein
MEANFVSFCTICVSFIPRITDMESSHPLFTQLDGWDSSELCFFITVLSIRIASLAVVS